MTASGAAPCQEFGWAMILLHYSKRQHIISDSTCDARYYHMISNSSSSATAHRRRQLIIGDSTLPLNKNATRDATAAAAVPNANAMRGANVMRANEVARNTSTPRCGTLSQPARSTADSQRHGRAASVQLPAVQRRPPTCPPRARAVQRVRLRRTAPSSAARGCRSSCAAKSTSKSTPA